VLHKKRSYQLLTFGSEEVAESAFGYSLLRLLTSFGGREKKRMSTNCVTLSTLGVTPLPTFVLDYSEAHRPLCVLV